METLTIAGVVCRQPSWRDAKAGAEIRLRDGRRGVLVDYPHPSRRKATKASVRLRARGSNNEYHIRVHIDDVWVVAEPAIDPPA